jgi:membrane-associated phospholipid phosphatase
MRTTVISLTAILILINAEVARAQEREIDLIPQCATNEQAVSKDQHSPAVNFFVALANDVKHLPSLDTAITLGIGGALALGASPADSRLTRKATQTQAFEETFDPGEVVGGAWVQAGGAAATLVVGHLSSSPRVQAVGSDLLRAQILNGALTQGLKHAVDRTRPDGRPYSFPSGHASASFASAAVLQRQFGWKVGVPAYAAATYAATSRLSENRHYASDVIFGAALGIVAGRTVTVGSGEHRFAFAPVTVPGGFALEFARVPKP